MHSDHESDIHSRRHAAVANTAAVVARAHGRSAWNLVGWVTIMDGYIFRFDAKKFRAIPRRYLGFLVASGHCCNELSILLPYIIFEHDLTNANEFEAAFIQSRKFTIDRIIISKIVEHGELCSKFFKANTGSPDAQLLELKEAYEPIASKIDSAKWARIMRNRISFHYDPKQALDALDLLDDNHPLRLMAGSIKGLTLFEFAEEITSRPIFESAGSGDIGEGMDAAHVFIRDLVGEITRFQSQATIAMFKSFGMVSERIQTELRDRYCAAPGEVRMPISISSGYLEARRSK